MLDKVKEIKKTEDKARRVVEKAHLEAAEIRENISTAKSDLQDKYEKLLNVRQKELLDTAVKSAGKEVDSRKTEALAEVKEVEAAISKNLTKAVSLITGRLTGKD